MKRWHQKLLPGLLAMAVMLSACGKISDTPAAESTGETTAAQTEELTLPADSWTPEKGAYALFNTEDELCFYLELTVRDVAVFDEAGNHLGTWRYSRDEEGLYRTDREELFARTYLLEDEKLLYVGYSETLYQTVKIEVEDIPLPPETTAEESSEEDLTAASQTAPAETAAEDNEAETVFTWEEKTIHFCAYIAASGTKLLAEPRNDAEVKGSGQRYDKGYYVYIIGESGDWYHIHDVMKTNDGSGRSQTPTGLDGYVPKAAIALYYRQTQ